MAISAGSSPEKSIEKKLRNEDEIRDNNSLWLSGYQSSKVFDSSKPRTNAVTKSVLVKQIHAACSLNHKENQRGHALFIDMATKKKTASKKSSSGSDPKSKSIVKKKMDATMHEFKKHKLESGKSGEKVKNPKQAIAIGLSEARRSGAKIPPPPVKKAATKKTAAKRTATKKSASRKST